jgi:hypothetical protein
MYPIVTKRTIHNSNPTQSQRQETPDRVIINDSNSATNHHTLSIISNTLHLATISQPIIRISRYSPRAAEGLFAVLDMVSKWAMQHMIINTSNAHYRVSVYVSLPFSSRLNSWTSQNLVVVAVAFLLGTNHLTASE